MNNSSPFAYPDFWKVWIGNFVSRIGSEMTFAIAVPYQVYQLTAEADRPEALGTIGLARAIPIILTALVGGVIADAFDRRRLLMMTQLVFMALASLLAYCAFQGSTTVSLLYAVTLAGGVLVALDLPARQALLPNLIPPEAFPRAVSLNAAAFQLAAVFGPALGGVVLAWKGPSVIYAIDAVTFLALFLGIALVRYRRTVEGPKLSLEGVFEGVKFVYNERALWATMTLDFLATFFAGAMLLMSIFVFDILKGDKHDYGYMLMAPAIGAAAVAIVMSYVKPPRWQGAAILGGVVVYGVASALMGWSNNFWVAFVLLAVAGAGDSISMIVRNTLRQELTPDQLRARMVSFNMIFFVGGPLLGEYEAGKVAHYFPPVGTGVRISIISGGIACVICAVLYAIRYPWLLRYERVTPRPL